MAIAMDKTAPTLELRDIHLPGDPSIWPLAPGWWILIVCACIVVYFIIKKIIIIKNQNHLNNVLQNELLKIRTDYKKHDNKNKLAAEISALLNRFVRHVLGDSDATSLTGEAWVNYLNSRVKNNVFDKFSMELTQAQYMPEVEFDVPSLMATVKNYFPTAIKSIKQFNKDKRRSTDA